MENWQKLAGTIRVKTYERNSHLHISGISRIHRGGAKLKDGSSNLLF